MRRVDRLMGIVGLVLVCATVTQADMAIDTTTVGNPGNDGELSGQGAGVYGPDRICGTVDYAYDIGQYEVTAGQYREFLNAVAADDPHDLYNASMWSSSHGCKIERTGSSGSYTYSVDPNWADRPVNYISWGDAARFCNWLQNGQPGLDTAVPQDANSTEDGSYQLNGAMTDAELLAITREESAQWVIPSEDEWYKAAYHKNDGVTGNYFDYPTGTDTPPSNDLIDPDPGNNSTFYASDYTIGSPYWRTKVGAHENSESPYGTFDQGGNVDEWTEGLVYNATTRGLRGAAYGISAYGVENQHAAFRHGVYPTYTGSHIGFRVALVPEPATLVMLACGLMVVLCRRY